MPAHRRLTLYSRVTALLFPRDPLFTASACLNVTTGPHGWPENYFGYRPGHSLMRAADPDMPALALAFTVQAPDPLAAAHRAVAVGRRLEADRDARHWPRRLRRLAVGDVVVITPRTPATGPRRFYALASGGGLTELAHIGDPLPFLLFLPPGLPNR
ncbi:hypothetical protein ACFC58_43525, partial [Kitasatospora purpeofusca]|uniref:hypothetical protein n=1 Tax=Kitasatospora purpeofusca TaxID=67352 RepID=UPI0035DE74B5